MSYSSFSLFKLSEYIIFETNDQLDWLVSLEAFL